MENMENPFASAQVKKELAAKTNLSIEQIINWIKYNRKKLLLEKSKEKFNSSEMKDDESSFSAFDATPTKPGSSTLTPRPKKISEMTEIMTYSFS